MFVVVTFHLFTCLQNLFVFVETKPKSNPHKLRKVLSTQQTAVFKENIFFLISKADAYLYGLL